MNGPNCERCFDEGIIRVEDNGPGEPACCVPCNCRTRHLTRVDIPKPDYKPMQGFFRALAAVIQPTKPSEPRDPCSPAKAALPLAILGPGGDFTRSLHADAARDPEPERFDEATGPTPEPPPYTAKERDADRAFCHRVNKAAATLAKPFSDHARPGGDFTRTIGTNLDTRA